MFFPLTVLLFWKSLTVFIFLYSRALSWMGPVTLCVVLSSYFFSGSVLGLQMSPKAKILFLSLHLPQEEVVSKASQHQDQQWSSGPSRKPGIPFLTKSPFSVVLLLWSISSFKWTATLPSIYNAGNTGASV